MYWKIFTLAGKKLIRMEHTQENLPYWADTMEQCIKQGIRVFSNVYDNKGNYLGPMSKIKPEK